MLYYNIKEIHNNQTNKKGDFMKGLIKAFLVIAIIAGGLFSIKLTAEIFSPNLKKYYSVDR